MIFLMRTYLIKIVSRWFNAKIGICLLLVGWILGGCVSHRAEEGTNQLKEITDVDKGDDGALTLSGIPISKDAEKEAEAIAQFASGIIYEIEGNTNALQAYLEALKNNPLSPAIYTRVASIYLKQNNPDAAIKTIQDGCKAMPNNGELRMILGHIYSMLNRPDDAEKFYREAIRVEPDDANKYLALTSFLKERNKYDEAMKILDEALQKTKDTASILRIKGDLMLSKALGEQKTLSREDYQKITEYYEKSLIFTNDAFSPQYYERLGDMHIQFRNYEKALKAYQSALIRMPQDEQLSKKVAMCFVALGKRKEAAEILKKIIKLNNEADFNLLQYLGELYESMGDLTNAATCYDDAIKLAPSNAPSLYFKLAAIYATTNLNKAIEVLNNGVKAVPNNYELIQTLATLYLQNKEKQSALTLFETAERFIDKSSQKPNVNFYMTYGFTALMNKDFLKAIANYDKAIELMPDNIDAYLMKAQCFVEMHNYQKACATLIKALAVQPANPFVWFHYGILATRMERYDEAVSIFELVEKIINSSNDKIQSMPFYNDFLFAYASSLERIKEYERAEKMLLELIKREPNDPEPYNYLAYTWAELNIKLETALLFVEHAIELDPDNGAFLDTLGWIYFKQNKPDMALDYLLQAAELAPEEPVIFEHIAEVYEKLNKSEEAARYLRMAVQKRNLKEFSTPLGYLLDIMEADKLFEALIKALAGEANTLPLNLQNAPP